MKPSPPRPRPLFEGGRTTRHLLRDLFFDAEAATMVEYALMVALIAGAAVVAAAGLGPAVALKFELVVAGFEGSP